MQTTCSKAILLLCKICSLLLLFLLPPIRLYCMYISLLIFVFKVHPLLVIFFCSPLPFLFHLLLVISSPFFSPKNMTVRLEQPFDMSTTVKFAYIVLAGNNVPFVKKGKFGVVQGAIESLFSVRIRTLL